MKLVKQSLGIFLFLVALAYSSWYLGFHSASKPLDPETLNNTTDSVITNLRVRQYNEQGKLINYLESPLMQHVPHDNTNKFFKPHFILGQLSQPNWDIQADSAESVQKGEKISFRGSVKIHQAQGEHNQESTMETESLDYFPKKKFASTKALVKFQQPGSTIRSKGMNAYLEDKHIELLSKTQVRYEPKKNV